MKMRTYAATVRRVLSQLLNDRRTIALILAVPALLVTLLYFIYRDYPGGDALFDRVAVQMIAILPMSVMFLVTSITMLKERVSGTLERLWTTPMRRADLLMGYATAFTVIAVGQALVLSAVCAWALGVTIAGNWIWIILTALLDAFVGVAMGLLVSALSRTEFQAVQFMPLLIGVQVFLCGMLVPRGQLPSALEPVSQAMPMSWAVNAVGEVQAGAAVTQGLVMDAVVLAVIGLVLLTAAPLTMPRRTR
ncbi:ABC transporter component [Actinomyces sp. Chiba101]|uniref:ABC transporter permease n=1 Tax=Actinomyces TaxID=1654 RepID=UPI000974EC48|nr:MULTISPECIES: ABC transporter permease [Actinomyces]BAW92913.1 ABC transporter component [Actinomyces sp. Chiba101]GAV94105.1 DrrB family ABC superfamily ATP binding cassette transporter efflux protein [Actinomyces denticolens]SUU06296.1 Inner membrane transport permease ybhR [Actinomyces denticolens]